MIKVLNISLYSNTLSSAVSCLIMTCLGQQEKLNKSVSATGAHGLVTAYRNKHFADVLKGFFWNLPDGMPGVWIGRLKGAKDMERCYGPDFFKEVMIASASTPIRHYFCGGKSGVADELRSVCSTSFNNQNIVGTFCPPFRPMTHEEFQSLASDINEKQPHVVWIGLGTPKQEIFAQQLSGYIKVHFIITVGAAFDFHTGRVVQAPRMIQKIGCEWLFRLCMEPRRLYKRYAEIVPLFIYFNLKEYVAYISKKAFGGRNV